MAAIPKLLSAKAEKNKHLRVLFENGVEKIYDCKQVINRFGFHLLNNDVFFKLVHIDRGGYGVSWNADIDLSEYELWTNGTTVNKGDRIPYKD